jgi:hypothetical protein
MRCELSRVAQEVLRENCTTWAHLVLLSFWILGKSPLKCLELSCVLARFGSVN